MPGVSVNCFVTCVMTRRIDDVIERVSHSSIPSKAAVMLNMIRERKLCSQFFHVVLS